MAIQKEEYVTIKLFRKVIILILIGLALLSILTYSMMMSHQHCEKINEVHTITYENFKNYYDMPLSWKITCEQDVEVARWWNGQNIYTWGKFPATCIIEKEICKWE